MKNVTITLEEDVARWTRIQAAEKERSVSRFVGEMLRDRMMEQKRYRAAMKRFLARKPVPLGGGPYPRREEFYDRKGLR